LILETIDTQGTVEQSFSRRRGLRRKQKRFEALQQQGEEGEEEEEGEEDEEEKESAPRA
jgi:hypothetical protein